MLMRLIYRIEGHDVDFRVLGAPFVERLLGERCVGSDESRGSAALALELLAGKGWAAAPGQEEGGRDHSHC